MFHYPVLRDPFKRWVNKLKYYTSHLHFRFSVIFLSKLLCPDLQNALAAATLEKNLGSLMSKRSDDSCLQENQELQTTCTLSMTCQIDVVNKQLVPPLSWNYPFSKTYWWLIYRHVDAKAKCTPMQKITYLVHTQFVDSIVKGTLL